MSVYGQFSDSYAPIMDGVAIVVQNYARRLSVMGHRTVVVAPKVPDYADTDPFEIVRMQSVAVPPKKPYRLQMPVLSPVCRRRLDLVPFDLIHAHSPLVAGAEAARVARRHGIPLVTTFHSKLRDDFIQVFRNDWLCDAILNSFMRFYERADVVWTVNESTLRTLREYGFQGRVDVIPNGCDMAGVEHDAAEAAAFVQAQCGLPPDVPALLFVGQMAQVKNPMLVVSACAEAIRAGSPCHLLMIGEGPSLQALKDQAAQLNIGDRVHFLGVIRNRDTLARFYTRANLFVFPSLYDNAPLVVREAASMGCPSLLLKGANAAEGVTDGENGFLADSAELAAFSRRVIALLGQPELLRAAGARARETLVFSWDSLVQDVAGRYQEILREYQARPTRKRLSQK
jgi:glycosyltransferase involved in cell wall biosynthesis